MQIDWFLVALATVVFIVGGYGVLILINDRRGKREPSNQRSRDDENRTVTR